ncbi:MAG: ADP-heptose:LPS heptosyltransferase-like protein [Planctomycetaceae bacterium]|nr:ADP-heptose:LPS heptosyltransferase-like protein [Planctomycetaceae bacterium]
MQRLILRTFQSPGDVLMLTAAVRDLHFANPGRFQIDVRTSADALWQHNRHLVPLKEGDAGVRVIEMHYPLVHQSNRPYHFIHGYAQYLEQQLGVSIPLTEFRGDIRLSDAEKAVPCPGAELGVPEHFWIIVAGGKYDFTAKWWNPDAHQQVVDHYQGKICFVQCGEKGHWHTPLKGVVNLIGKTELRDFVRLMHHADGVLCPVTFAMHLAAAVETKPGRPKHRPCVVVAGGREPAHWEAYPNHQFLSMNGALPCCADGGCWKSRCQLVGDGDAKDRNDVCSTFVQLTPDLRIPKCMDMITAQDVIRRIELYYDGGMLRYGQNGASVVADATKTVNTPASRGGQIGNRQEAVDAPNGNGKPAVTTTLAAVCKPQPKVAMPSPAIALKPVEAVKPDPIPLHEKTSVTFYHGLGDCAYFAPLIAMYTKRGYPIEVECTPDKRILFEAAGATTIPSGAQHVHHWGYPAGGTHESHGEFWKGSKPGHNISESPLPFIGPKSELWDEYCATKVDVTPLLSASAFVTVDQWLSRLPRPIVLLHTKGNTAQGRKSLPDSITSELYPALLDRFDGSLILLDWDRRVPRLASYRVRHLDDLGACSTEVLFALMSRANLLIGVDSGPLHAAQLTKIPSIGLWMPGHYPATYTLPRRQQLNIVLRDQTRQWNKYKRIPWNIIEHPGSTFNAETLADLCRPMLDPPKYFRSSDMGADVQTQWFIQNCRGIHGGNSLSPYADRHHSFDKLFREISNRFPAPVIVETGTIRSEEDWSGAGFFTYLAGSFVSRFGGSLTSVDIDGKKCQFARDWCSIFGPSVTVTQQDSVAFLREFSNKIDVLYLDSLDTTEPGHADHCVKEFEAAQPQLHGRSIVVIDDTPWNAGAFVGKGARLVPQLLEQGWRILYAGYQVVLSK